MNSHLPQQDPQSQMPALPPSPAFQVSTDYILVPRPALEQLLNHLTNEYARFPTRHLRQAIRIVEHVLRRIFHSAA